MNRFIKIFTIFSLISINCLAPTASKAESGAAKWACFHSKLLSEKGGETSKPTYFLKCSHEAQEGDEQFIADASGRKIIVLQNYVAKRTISPEAVMIWRTFATHDGRIVPEEYTGIKPTNCDEAPINEGDSNVRELTISKWACQ